MKKLIRNRTTTEADAFWRFVEESAAAVAHLPQWMKVGVIVKEGEATAAVANDDPATKQP